MAIKRVQKKIDWTPEDQARHNAVREKFKAKPTLEELVSTGELTGQPIPLGTFVSLRLVIRSLRRLREQAGLSLADVEARSGMDKAALSRLESGHVPNPGIETIARYLEAIGRMIEWRVTEAPRKQRERKDA